jgi:FkbM family methyltransferase
VANQAAARQFKAPDTQCLSANHKSQWGETAQALAWLFTNEHGAPLHGGVYFEIGALDGERYSNTYVLEKCLGWRGLLIEAQPENFAQLKKNRCSGGCGNVLIGEAVCDTTNGTLGFTAGGGPVAGQPEFFDEKFKMDFYGANDVKTIKVPCNPLSYVFDQHGFKKIDFWSLDVEGAELAVLQTVNWSRVEISVIMMENAEDKKATDEAGKRSIEAAAILVAAGYTRIGRVGPGNKPYKSEVWGSTTFFRQNPNLQQRVATSKCVGGAAPTAGEFLGAKWPAQCFRGSTLARLLAGLDVRVVVVVVGVVVVVVVQLRLQGCVRVPRRS